MAEAAEWRDAVCPKERARLGDHVEVLEPKCDVCGIDDARRGGDEFIGRAQRPDSVRVGNDAFRHCHEVGYRGFTPLRDFGGDVPGSVEKLK